MRSTPLLLLPLLAIATPVDVFKREPQLNGLLGALLGGGSSAMKPAKIIDLTPQVRSDAKRQQLVWGPFSFVGSNNSIPGGNPMGMRMDPRGQINIRPMAGFCKDCAVVHGATYISHADGSRVDVDEGAYLHHLLFLNPTKMGKSYYSCSQNGAASRLPVMPSSYFLGAGVDKSEYFFGAKDAKFESAYHIGAKDNFLMQSEIVNYNVLPQEWFIAVDYEYMPSTNAPEKATKMPDYDVSVTDFNVNNCMGFLDAGYHAPMNTPAFSKTSPDFKFTQDGTIIRAMGHLHDGGTNIILKINGKEICNSAATYGGERGTLLGEDGKKWETISDMTVCDNAFPILKGDVMTMTSVYNLTAHPLRETTNGMEMEEMGIYTIFFATKST